MEHDCPIVSRVTALEISQARQDALQEKQAETMDTMCVSINRMANSVEKLVEILPLITLAQAIRQVSVWIAPILAAVAAGWTAYWAIMKFWPT